MLCVFGLLGCEEEFLDENGGKILWQKECELIVASTKVPGVVSSDGFNHFWEVYAAKRDGSQEWESFSYLSDFEYEAGYEYKLLVEETAYRVDTHSDIGYKVVKVLSKEKKDSEGVPNNFVLGWFYFANCFITPESDCFVQAEEKEAIENDLKSHPAVTGNGGECWLFDDLTNWSFTDKEKNKNILEYGEIKEKERGLAELPDYYSSFLPEKKVKKYSQWDFVPSGNPEDSRIRFDVLKCAEDEWGDDLSVWLYSDLTEYYRQKYPDAGVTAVLVRREVKQADINDYKPDN